MDLGNLIKTILHYLLIRGVTYLGHRDGFPMTSALLYMITHWIGTMINHYISHQIVMIHQTTIPHEISTLKEY